MKIGTQSVLFGVHQFVWHPLTVALAWKRVHGRWPNWWESICIFCHDLGYWGLPDMDGTEGKLHPQRGAILAFHLVSAGCRLLRKSPSTASVLTCCAYKLTLYHSGSMAQIDGRQPSRLYLPDKVSILFDPQWLYLIRSRLTGEIHEYVNNSPFANSFKGLDRQWLVWYKSKVKRKLKSHEKTCCPTD